MNENFSGSGCLVEPQAFGAAALRRYYARHVQADDMQHNAAAFTWSKQRQAFQIEVCGYIVAEPSTLPEVVAFCLMHNSRIVSLKP